MQAFFRSGDSGAGGYFVIGHDVLPFPDYSHVLGKALIAFSQEETENGQIASVFGQRLTTTRNQREASVIGRQILETFPSITSGQERPGLLVDPRFIAHKIRQPLMLRDSPGKGYYDRPHLVACYHT